MKPTEQQIVEFLFSVDKLFPIPLSQKQNLVQYARKLEEKATICYELNENNQIISMVAGYTENLLNSMAYISLVATLPAYSGKGKATTLVQQYIEICRKKRIVTVHLYAAPTNITAVHMYEKLGFQCKNIKNEVRPDDLHLFINI